MSYFNPYQTFYPQSNMNMTNMNNLSNQMNMPPIQQSPTQDERIWVSSYQAAESYLVAPNSSVRLWDSSKPCFYEKRADASGRLFPIEIYEYKKKTQEVEIGSQEVDRYEELKKRIEDIERRLKDESDADDTTVQKVSK